MPTPFLLIRPFVDVCRTARRMQPGGPSVGCRSSTGSKWAEGRPIGGRQANSGRIDHVGGELSSGLEPKRTRVTEAISRCWDPSGSVTVFMLESYWLESRVTYRVK